MGNIAEHKDRLTERAYWDSQYDGAASSEPPRRPSGTHALLRKIAGPKLRDLVQDYRDYLVWNVLYSKYLPRRRGARVLEVGSAPGHHLVALHEAYGFEPYGVEYAPQGAELNRKVFQSHGLDPANVIQADFLAPEFQTRYRGQFDIVFSRGFIEHFTSVESVVSAHINVVAPGGMLFVSIPNLRGINYGLTWFFHKELLPLHNLAIMRRERFARLFESQPLEPLFCDYFGAFSFGLFDGNPARFKHAVLTFCRKAQLPLNAALRIFFKHGGVEHRWFSSHLVFIGLKPC
jgi:2-polyprenyl-3-methyl-5-hydroxy-6-metoxy-1,4-benzoquinol methylase